MASPARKTRRRVVSSVVLTLVPFSALVETCPAWKSALVETRPAWKSGGHAALRKLISDQMVPSAFTRSSMSESECSGEGVIRSRSVPRGTVG